MARWQFRPPVERTRQGYRINIADRERDVVRRLLQDLLLAGPLIVVERQAGHAE